MTHYDCIIAGLGAMGSAAAYHLARAGSRLLGLDQFQPPHPFGSSHGRTRIIRETYFEDPAYVPLVQRAYQLWADLETQSTRKILLQTGGLMIGAPDGVLVSGARNSARKHHLRHEVLTADELRRKFPVLKPAPEMVGVWEPRAGVLFPEVAIQTHLELAAQGGATLQFNEPLLRWEPDGNSVRVRTRVGTYTADRLLLAAGSWLAQLVPDLKLPLTVERQVLYWFAPRSQASAFQPTSCPIHIWEYEAHRFFYGFPDLGDGIKAALHHQGEQVQPNAVRREVDPREVESMRGLLGRFLPEAEGPLRETAVCLYTNTPDEHFLLDWHPHHPQVLLASPCSGHGFKFSSVIGELIAQLLRGQKPPFDLTLFKANRLLGT